MNTTDTEQRNLATSLCKQQMSKLGWEWNEPRILDWLDRVMRIKHRTRYQTLSQVPPDYLVTLARFLDIYFKCDCLLKALKANWSHSIVRAVQQKYGCINRLPLKGYQELERELEDALHFEPIPF